VLFGVESIIHFSRRRRVIRRRMNLFAYEFQFTLLSLLPEHQILVHSTDNSMIREDKSKVLGHFIVQTVLSGFIRTKESEAYLAQEFSTLYVAMVLNSLTVVLHYTLYLLE